jgi:predicted PurR-regulated permease PerM
MSDGPSETRKLDLGNAAALTVLVVSIVVAVFLLYYLIDIVILLFLGIVVAAAVQPWHERLCRLGMSKGLAVLLIYLLFAAALILIGLLVVPVLIEEMSKFAAGFPEEYAATRATLQASPTGLLRLIGERLPPFAALTQSLSGFSATFFAGALGFTTGTVTFVASLVTVLVVGFYWTMEVPHLERLILSFFPVARRAQVLTIWHEIEFKLGAFIRGQGLAMLAIGVVSGLGYFLIGLPHVLMLAVLAGLMEAVPLLGPILAAVPAILVALPLGLTTVLLVIGFSALVQFVENNWLIPRLMSHAVGVSALVALVAVLAFGTLYGVLGIFIAIPLAAVMQVLLDRMVINVEPVPEASGVTADPLAGLRARVRALRQQMRARLRERDTRMGIDAQTPDHVVDAADQHIEQAVERVEQMITTAQDTSGPIDAEGRATIVEGLQDATQHIEQAVDQVDTLMTAAQDSAEANGPTVEMPLAELSQATQDVAEAVERVKTVMVAAQDASGPLAPAERETIVEELDQATQQMRQGMGQVGTLKTAAQEGAEASGSTVGMPLAELTHATQQVEAAVERVDAVKIATQEPTGSSDPEEREAIVEELEEATQQIKQAVERVDTLMTVAPDSKEPSKPVGKAVAVEAVQHATQQVEAAVERVETALPEAQNESDSGAEGEAPSRTAPNQPTPQVVKPA